MAGNRCGKSVDTGTDARDRVTGDCGSGQQAQARAGRDHCSDVASCSPAGQAACGGTPTTQGQVTAGASRVWSKYAAWWTSAGGLLLVASFFIAVRYLAPMREMFAQNTPGKTQPSGGKTTATLPPPRTSTPPSSASRNSTAAGQHNTQVQAGAPGASAAIPAVVAVVNGTTITREQLGQECIRRYGEDVLESMVNRNLIEMECQRRGVQITDHDVRAEVDRMASKFGLSTDRWLALLKEERNITPEQYYRDVVWPMLALRRLAAGQIEVTPEELKKAFETEYGPKVKVRIIAAKDRATAESLRAKVLQDPESFGDVAKDFSTDQSSAAARGLIPPMRKHTAPPELESAVFSLEEGQISEVIPVADQFFIVKCERKIPETYVTGSQLKEIQDRLVDQIRDQKLRAAAAQLFKQLQDAAKVVNVYNHPQLQKEMPGVAALINGRPIALAELAQECIQRHGEEVLDGEINRVILEQALAARQLTVSQADLDAEVREAADAYGFVKSDGTPDVDAWLRHITSDAGEHVSVDVYMRDVVWPSVALKKLVGSSVEVTEEDLQKGFQAHYGERVEVLAIVLANQRRAQQVWEMARDNPSEEFFGELAAQYSVEPVSKANFGRVPPIRRYSGNELVENEAFRLKPGELSGIVAVGDKFIIMKCLGRTEPVVTDLSEVREELTKEIQQQKLRVAMNAEFERLRQAAKIQVYLTGVVKRGLLSSHQAEGIVR